MGTTSGPREPDPAAASAAPDEAAFLEGVIAERELAAAASSEGPYGITAGTCVTWCRPCRFDPATSEDKIILVDAASVPENVSTYPPKKGQT
jgi:hypothetical protein